MNVYGDRKSGNCLKVRYVCDYLAIDYQWTELDVVKGDSRTAQSLALNPMGQVPYVEFPDGRVLSQSNAIMLYLARDSALLPKDPWQRALVDQWLAWEQYSHEPNIAVCRFDMFYLGKSESERDPARVKRGEQALDLMDRHLAESPWFTGDSLTVGDIGLLAYTRMAHEGAFDLSNRRNVVSWIQRCENTLGIAPITI